MCKINIRFRFKDYFFKKINPIRCIITFIKNEIHKFLLVK
jgi:hypothetical protein